MKEKIFSIISLLFGLLLINGGLDKFFHYMPVPADLHPELVKDQKALEEIIWLVPLIASAEILGGLLLLLSRTRALGALIVLPVMTGVLLTHLFVDPSQLLTAVVIWILLTWILWENRNRYKALIQKSRS